jgi:hypothetical protein
VAILKTVDRQVLLLFRQVADCQPEIVRVVEDRHEVGGLG